MKWSKVFCQILRFLFTRIKCNPSFYNGNTINCFSTNKWLLQQFIHLISLLLNITHVYLPWPSFPHASLYIYLSLQYLYFVSISHHFPVNILLIYFSIETFFFCIPPSQSLVFFFLSLSQLFYICIFLSSPLPFLPSGWVVNYQLKIAEWVAYRPALPGIRRMTAPLHPG